MPAVTTTCHCVTDNSKRIMIPHSSALAVATTLCLLLFGLCAYAIEIVDRSDTPPSTATHTLPPSTFYPPPRTLTPTFPRLHVLFVVGSATYTHVAAPIEYMLELKRRGHRITWQQPRFLTRWFTSEAERLSLPFNFSLVDLDSAAVESVDGVAQLMSERPWIEVFAQLVRQSWDPVYPAYYHAMLDAIEQDRPDIVVCDSISDHCLDVADKLQLPMVISHCTTPIDGFAPHHYDTPSSFTLFSHNWHEQPLWHRLYNTFGIAPQLVWYGAVGLTRHIDAVKAAMGSPGQINRGTRFHSRDVLYDSSWAWEWPQYWPPYLHMVGPIPKTWRQASQQLTVPQQQWLGESAAAGVPVVYVAMGSLAKLSDEWLRTFAAAFSSCPALPAGMSATANTSLFRVLWANRHSPPWLAELLPASVRLEQWVSQPAVLAHPAVHLFLSHSGMSSAQEAIAVGLPILALPLLIDQPSIAAKLRDRGVADVLDKLTFTSDELCASMRRLVFSAAVRQSASSLQRLFHASDSGGLQRAVDVIERAAVSMAHLRPYRERQEVSWVVRHNVDVYGCGLLAGLAVLWCVVAAVSVVVRLVVSGMSALMAGVGAASRRKSKQA